MVVDWQSVSVENRALMLDLVEWIARGPRSYTEVMETWRTSCPRLPVWEEAIRLGLVNRVCEHGIPMVLVTHDGQAFLRSHDRA